MLISRYKGISDGEGVRELEQEFVAAVKDVAKKQSEQMHTALPGEIKSFDTSKGLATVIPKAKFKKPDGETMDFPEVTGVPVVFPQGNNQQATIAFPVKQGDSCLVVFAESALDYWQYGKETDTELKFDLTNAICIPGLYSQANSVMKKACDNNAVVVDVQGTQITVSGGTVQIDAGSVIINGNITLNGTMTATGTVNATGAITSGADVTASGSMTAGGTITASGDVTGSGISLASHTHTGDSGGTTSGPQ